MNTLQPFRKQFLRAALSISSDNAALSLPRDNGKSWFAGAYLGSVSVFYLDQMDAFSFGMVGADDSSEFLVCHRLASDWVGP